MKRIVSNYNFFFQKLSQNSDLINKNFLYIKYLLLFVLIYFPLFQHLDSLPIRLWDESRLAINAFEMYKDGDMIVTHFEGKPDMWNTKPPFLLWCQSGLMKIIGVNELAMRLPSAIAALLTCLLILLVGVKYLKSFWYGFFTIFVLVTTQGYVDLHCTRTGDYDAMLIFFTTFYCLSYFLFIQTEKKKYLYLFFFAASFAVLTKSIVGVLFFPGLLIYTLLQKKFLPLLKNIHFYLGTAVFLSVVIGYYLLRNMHNPGYIMQVWQNELGGRYLEVMEEHSESNLYYLNKLINTQFSFYYLFVPVGMLLGKFLKNERIASIVNFATVLSIQFLIVVSVSKTKLIWYDTPVFPFLALLTAACLYFIYTSIIEKFFYLQQTKIDKSKLVLTALIVVIPFIEPYSQILRETFKPKEDEQYMPVKDFYGMSYYLRDIIKGKTNPGPCYLVTDGYVPHIDFYYNILREKNLRILKKNANNLLPGDAVLTTPEVMKIFVEQNFYYEITIQQANIRLIKLIGKK